MRYRSGQLSMNIDLNKLGRRFNRDWIFRHVNYRIESGGRYAVLGPNGSGKSTFLQVLAGSLTPSEGTVTYTSGSAGSPGDNGAAVAGSTVEVENVYRHLSLAAPYLELMEELTLSESIDFHFRFKNYLSGLDARHIVELLGFEKFTGREVRYFSSGMKQRLKLVLALCSDTPLLLLDEPTANLDQQGISWYHSLIERFAGRRTVIVCSNQVHEYEFCPEHISMLDYK